MNDNDLTKEEYKKYFNAPTKKHIKWSRAKELLAVGFKDAGLSEVYIAKELKITPMSVRQKFLVTGFINLTKEECDHFGVLHHTSPMKQKRRSLIPPAVRVKVLDSYYGRCGYCGIIPKVLEIDHVKPFSKGGSDRIENLMPCCRKCNTAKGKLTLTRFRETKYKFHFEKEPSADSKRF